MGEVYPAGEDPNRLRGPAPLLLVADLRLTQAVMHLTQAVMRLATTVTRARSQASWRLKGATHRVAERPCAPLRWSQG